MSVNLIDCLRLIRSPRVGPITYHRLIARFKTPAEALAALPDLVRRGGQRAPVRVYSARAAEKELAACRAAQVRILTQDDKDFPPYLKHIEDSPPLLFVRGNAALLRKPAVAVIGSRNASTNGLRLAEKLSADLGESGLVVVSGMARGIDAAAHTGALASGTVAVLGGGVDVIYPLENRELYRRITDDGAVVSEMPLGTQPKAAHFPRRNRLISGISQGVIVVEAAPRSGSLITARLALEQGRDVFAVPGAAIDPRARGTNDLIRQGAILTETALDVLDVVQPVPLPTQPVVAPAPVPGSAARPSDTEASEICHWLTKHLGPTPVEINDLAREIDAPAAKLSEALIELELAGRVERHPGNMISALVPL